MFIVYIMFALFLRRIGYSGQAVAKLTHSFKNSKPSPRYPAQVLLMVMVMLVSMKSYATAVQGPDGMIKTKTYGVGQVNRKKLPCYPKLGMGPLTIKSQSPLQTLRLSLIPRLPFTLRQRHFELRTTATWVNIYAEEQNYTLDYETIQPSVSLAYGINNNWQFDIAVEQWTRFGGALDSISEGFHDLFGISQNGRDEIPDGTFRFNVHAPDQQPVTLTHDGSGTYSRAILATLQHNVTCGTAILPALSYAVTLRRHIGGAEYVEGGNNTDVALSMSAARKFNFLYGYLTLGYSWFGQDNFQGIALRKQQLTIISALEWPWRATQSFFFQYHWTEGLAHNVGALSEASNEIVLGWKGEMSTGSTLEIGLIENIFTFDNSPDFGFHMGLSWQF